MCACPYFVLVPISFSFRSQIKCAPVPISFIIKHDGRLQPNQILCVRIRDLALNRVLKLADSCTGADYAYLLTRLGLETTGGGTHALIPQRGLEALQAQEALEVQEALEARLVQEAQEARPQAQGAQEARQVQEALQARQVQEVLGSS